MPEFIKHYSLLIVFAGGALWVLSIVVAQIRQNRRQGHEHILQLFGPDVSEAEIRQLEKMGV